MRIGTGQVRDLGSGESNKRCRNGALGLSLKMLAGVAMYCGTVTVHGDELPSIAFDIELEEPVGKRIMSHGYRITNLPIAG